VRTHTAPSDEQAELLSARGPGKEHDYDHPAALSPTETPTAAQSRRQSCADAHGDEALALRANARLGVVDQTTDSRALYAMANRMTHPLARSISPGEPRPKTGGAARPRGKLSILRLLSVYPIPELIIGGSWRRRRMFTAKCHGACPLLVIPAGC
jgi:hypothetical protein